MNTYALIIDDDEDSDLVHDLLSKRFSGDDDVFYRQVSRHFWMLKANGAYTTGAISKVLFPRMETEKPPRHIVLKVGGYWGWNSPQLWEWLSE